MPIRRGSRLAVALGIPLAAAAVFGLFLDYGIVAANPSTAVWPMIIIIALLLLQPLWVALYIAWPRGRPVPASPVRIRVPRQDR